MKLKQQYAKKLESLEDLEAKKIIETALLKKYWIELNIVEACKMCYFLQEKQMTFINLLELLDE